LLAAALVWSVATDARFGSPWTPSLEVLLAGAVAGAAMAALMLLVAGRASIRPKARRLAPAAGVAAAAAIGALLSLAAGGYIDRSTRVAGSTQPAPELIAWFIEQPGFQDEDYPVSIASRAVLSSLAGDRFQHPLELVPARAECDSLLRRARREPLVVTTSEWFQGIIGVNPYTAPDCLAGSEPAYRQADHTVLLPERRMTAGSAGAAP